MADHRADLRRLQFVATGAIVAGRGTFEPAGGWGGDHHGGVPIFVLSRHEPPARFAQMPLVTYLNDIEDRDHPRQSGRGRQERPLQGAATAQRALAAGLLDEIEIHLIPVLLGQGRRLFDNLAAEQIELERIRVLEWDAGVTHIRYRVRR